MTEKITVSSLSEPMRNLLEKSLQKVSNDLADFCSATNLASTSINISGIKGDNCNVEVSGINQTIDVSVNSECINTQNKEVVDDALMTLKMNLKNDLIKNSKTEKIIYNIEKIIENERQLASTSTCMVNSIQSSTFNFLNNNIICPTITKTDIFGRKIDVPGTVKIKDIEQRITASLLNKCHAISDQLLKELHEYDMIINEEHYDNKNRPESETMSQLENIFSAEALEIVPKEHNPAKLKVSEIVAIAVVGFIVLMVAIGLAVHFGKRKK